MANIQPNNSDINVFPQVLIIQNQFNQLSTVSEWITQIGQSLSLSQRLVFGLDLVLNEAITNIIENAYNNDEIHNIQISFRVNNDYIEVELVDDGIPFDPLQHPLVEFSSSLEDAPIGGLGIHLIRSYTEACFYRRDHNHNYLIMKMSLDDT